MFKAGTCTNSTNFYFFKKFYVETLSNYWQFGANEMKSSISCFKHLCLKRVLAPIRQTFISLKSFMSKHCQFLMKLWQFGAIRKSFNTFSLSFRKVLQLFSSFYKHFFEMFLVLRYPIRQVSWNCANFEIKSIFYQKERHFFENFLSLYISFFERNKT